MLYSNQDGGYLLREIRRCMTSDKNTTGLTQSEFSKIIGISVTTIVKYEHNDPAPPVDKRAIIAQKIDDYYRNELNQEMPSDLTRLLNELTNIPEQLPLRDSLFDIIKLLEHERIQEKELNAFKSCYSGLSKILPNLQIVIDEPHNVHFVTEYGERSESIDILEACDVITDLQDVVEKYINHKIFGQRARY